MRVLVTGAAGFIGSHVCELFLKEGHEVIGLDDLSTGSERNVSSLAANPKFRFVQADIRHRESIGQYFEGVDWVLHLAGRSDIVPSIEQPTDYYDVNVSGTLNVLEAARRHGAKRFIYTASSSCYGIPDVYPTPESAPVKPEYPYALTKAMGEQLVMHWAKVYQLPALSLRLFNVYGPRSRTNGAYGAVFGVFLAQRLKGLPVTIVGDGEQTRDFTFVSDVARAFLAAAQSSLSGEIFNVGSGNHYSINRLVDLLDCERTYIPKRPGEPDCTFADTRAIREQLEWAPRTTFEEGVNAMLGCINDWASAPVWTSESIAEATRTWFNHLGREA
ncbi:UDP-glucose 4-epimerase [Paraburkholderia steynii]|uniref:UDP-glucose 4-epimerase n=1 Tax=Paraburkholderia steynii TaxID=1245441 RepID=A0A7Z7B7B9_9BURK|nr:SDR family oxidoreductase [Paraburkholderia steynii]SDH72448.1 UDP-glucose 4-epimerase [Paraburkholderia steynii]